jgi:osmotically-inducible protein OsmY
MKRLRLPIVLLAVLLGGCATLTGSDPGARSAQEISADERIEGDVHDRIVASDPRFKQSRIVVVSHKAAVLLAGEVQSEDLVQKAQEIASAAADVRRVHNELAVSSRAGIGTRTSDGWITTKVKSALVSNKVVDADRVNVTTVDGVVFLMGSVSRQEADEAVTVTQAVTGVRKIVRVFEYVD